MKKTRSRAAAQDEEPIGIVISRGAQTEKTPRLLAYVWGPAPEPTEEPGLTVGH